MRLTVLVLVTVSVFGPTLFGRAYADPVPKLVGRSIIEVEAEATRLGRPIEVDFIESSELLGLVVAQRPAAGLALDVGATIVVSVSAGMPVPSVIGKTQAEAIAKITARGISVEVTSRPMLDVPVGLVGVQVPAEGQNIDVARQAVFLTVSSQHLVTMPDVSQMSVPKAVELLESLGLSILLESEPLPLAGSCLSNYYSKVLKDPIPTPGDRLPIEITLTLQARWVRDLSVTTECDEGQGIQPN